jgi:hypothetical protein
MIYKELIMGPSDTTHVEASRRRQGNINLHRRAVGSDSEWFMELPVIFCLFLS